MENVDKVLADTMTKVVENIEAMALTHGDKAVELALLSYQMGAIEYLAGFLLAWLITLVPLRICVRAVRRTLADYNDINCRTDGEAVFFVVLVSAFPVSIFVVFTVQLINIKVWFAAFGYPELLIATKVLKTAGLM